MASRYQNPVFMFNPNRWSEKAQIRIMKLNIFLNIILPEQLLHRLNACKSSREYRQREAERLAKIEKRKATR